MNKILYLIIFLLIASFLLINVYPLYRRKFKKDKILSFSKLNEIKETIVNCGLMMIQSKKVHMSFNDEEGLYVFLSKMKSKFSKKSSNKYQYFNFPRAWLLNGLFDEYQESKREDIYKVLTAEVDKVIDGNGNLKFKFDKIDQSLFGLVLIKLYAKTNDDKYKKALEKIEKGVHKFIIPNTDLISYRVGTNVCFVDTLGMICPFFYLYAYEFDSNELRNIANSQIKYYIENGLDSNTKLPVHAIDLDNEMLLGSTNWGRGIGWFIVGLAYALKYTDSKNNKDYELFKDTYHNIINKLESIKLENCYWPQFVGHTNDNNIDTSATIMFNYAKHIVGEEVDINEIERFLKKSIDVEGFVLNSSGDTMYINKYSSKKGRSELTQGILLSLLSKK